MVSVHLPHEPALLPQYANLTGQLEANGYDGIWIGEVNAVDATMAAAVAASGTERADVGVLLNTFTRAPTVLAMAAWTLGNLAPGRAHVVLGVASPLLVQRWNGIAHRRLHDRLQDTLRFVRLSLAGGRVVGDFATITSDGFALPSAVEPAPELLIAACGPRALQLAAGEADGVVLNWVTPGDLDRIDPLPDARDRISLVVPVCPTHDRAAMERTMRPVMADYLQVPAYAAQQRRLGRGPALQQMWDAWAEGDRRGARAALPTSILDELTVWGEPQACRQRLRDIERDAGVRAIATYFPPPGENFVAAALDHSEAN